MFWSYCVASCGGGGSAGGPASASNSTSTANVANQAPATLVDGTATIDIEQAWSQWVENGYRRSGALNIYWQKDWGSMPLDSAVISRDLSNQRTTLRITHVQHGAQNGDQVTWSSLSIPTLNGLPKSVLEKTHTVTYRDDNSYSITVSGVATSVTATRFTAHPVFRYRECNGNQLVLQGPASATSPATVTKGFEALKAIRVTTTHLNQCSPTDSRMTASQYFKANGGTLALLGEDIENGSYTLVDDFVLPSGEFKTGDQGTIGGMTTYTSRSRTQLDSRTQLRFEVLKHTSQSVFLQLISEIREISGLLRATQYDLYGPNPEGTGSAYVLMRSTVKYNNSRKTEVVIDYTESLTQIAPSEQSGSGSIRAVPEGDQPWSWFAIDVTPYLFGGQMQIEVKLGSGTLAANMELTSVPPNTPTGPPVGSLTPAVKAEGAAPGSKTTLTFDFTNNINGSYYLGVQGVSGGAEGARNSFVFDAWVREAP